MGRKSRTAKRGQNRKPKPHYTGKKRQRIRLENSVGTRNIMEIRKRRESIENLMKQRGVKNHYDLSPNDQYTVMALRRGWGGVG